LVFGHFGIALPPEIQTVGLAAFIYAVGLKAGAGLPSSFREHAQTMARPWP
jgi:putative transport protein